jgi:DNA-binding MarR family transcriptional regulator
VSTDIPAKVWGQLLQLVFERYDRRAEVCAALDMSFVKTKALRRVARGPLTMRELTESLSTDRPYTTLVVDDLERRGLVVRTTHPEDRRHKVVTATKAGKAAADVANGILAEPPAPLLALADDDLAALDRILATLIEAD